MTCSFSKEFSVSAITAVENEFILQYLPMTDGEGVKVYLYGLFLCANPQYDKGLEEFATAVSLEQSTVIDRFNFFEEFGLVNVVSRDPFCVQYLPAKSASFNKPRKYKPEKYTEFTKGIQALLPTRMISTNEYTEYFNIMETYGIKTDAMLMIVRYCTDRKGNDVGYKYISAVARKFGTEKVTTVEEIEKSLADYVLRTNILESILKAMSSKRKPELEDLSLFKKWTEEMSFETENIIFSAKMLKKGNMEKLDGFLKELYSMKCFSKEEIAEYGKKKQAVYELTLKINKALSHYEDVLETEIDTFINKWLSYGFMEDALLYVASHCFVTGKNTLQNMDDLIETLYKKGFIDISSVGDYFAEQKRADEFMKRVLITCGISRRPTPWDKENLDTWRRWNFSDEMILEAAKISSGKSSAIAYMNGVLSNWKNNGKFTVQDVAETLENSNSVLTIEEYNRIYERRRSIALSKAQQNLDIAMEIQGFSALYERMFSIEKDLAFAELSGDKNTLNKYETEQKSLTEKIRNLLNEKGLTIADLSPKFSCEKCGDTGYIGTKRCDCLEKN